MGTPQRLVYDYKSVGLGQKRHIRRTPWFIAGAGVPLLCLAFILPDSDSAIAPQTEVDPAKATTEIDLVNNTEQPLVSSTETNEAGSVATQPPAIESLIETPIETVAGREVTLTVRRGDSLDRLFKRNSLSRTDLANIMSLEAARKYLRLVKPGDEIVVVENEGDVQRLERQVSLTEILRIERANDSFGSTMVEKELEARQIRKSGTIESSLFLAAAEAGVSDRTIMNLAGIFAWDVDFVLDIRQGDSFTLVFEEFWQDGTRVAEGDILAAEFVNQGEIHQAIRFEDPSGRTDYYTPEGRSMRKAFLRAPLSFSRISSNFNPKRRHPKLNRIRAHKGVDYAAPTGTPIKAAGDGKIVHRARKGGYGNTVIIQHGGNITTLYAHMSRYGKPRTGGRVRQGDVIGYVGATGLATGPHLHYEYRRSGVHLNPRTVKLPDAEPIKAEYLAAFQEAADPYIEQLENPRRLVAAQ